MGRCATRLGVLLAEKTGGTRMYRGTASNVTAGPPSSVTIDERTMRYIEGSTIANGDLVVYLVDGNQATAIGKLV